MTEATLHAAALERSRAIVTRADRPAERRCAERPGSFAAARVRAQIELRAAAGDGSTVEFDGIASAYELGYEMWDAFGPYTEIVTGGAGSASLARSDLDVPLVLAHDSLRRIARTTNGSLNLSELDAGLRANAPALDKRDQDVAYVLPKLEAGLLDEMSFRFSITSGQWSPDYAEYRINAYDIHRGDVAIVGYGANPHTSAEVRTATEVLAARGVKLSDLDAAGLRDHERLLRVELTRRGLRPIGVVFAELLASSPGID